MNNSTPKYIASFVIFLVFLALFLIVTFPTDVLKRRIVNEIEKSTNLKADIKDMKISPMLNVKLYEVRLGKDYENLNISIDRLSVSPSVLSLLLDRKKIPFTANVAVWPKHTGP